MQGAAAEVVDFLYERFCLQSEGGPQCVLLRCFKTHPFADLPPSLQLQARLSLGGAQPPADLRCLVLLASRGELPEWNGTTESVTHRVIPLASVAMVRRAPMIARLVVQMGLAIEDIVRPEPHLLIDAAARTFNVFHVEQAAGSAFVPAQDSFVLPYKVQSVLGFGGLLPSGELFAVVMFAKVRITRDTAELFRTLALGVKLVLLPFSGLTVFEPQPGEGME